MKLAQDQLAILRTLAAKANDTFLADAIGALGTDTDIYETQTALHPDGKQYTMLQYIVAMCCKDTGNIENLPDATDDMDEVERAAKLAAANQKVLTDPDTNTIYMQIYHYLAKEILVKFENDTGYLGQDHSPTSSPLMNAVEAGSLYMVKEFVQSDRSQLDSEFEGITPLGKAVYCIFSQNYEGVYNRLQIYQRIIVHLMQEGANPNKEFKVGSSQTDCIALCLRNWNLYTRQFMSSVPAYDNFLMTLIYYGAQIKRTHVDFIKGELQKECNYATNYFNENLAELCLLLSMQYKASVELVERFRALACSITIRKLPFPETEMKEVYAKAKSDVCREVFSLSEQLIATMEKIRYVAHDCCSSELSVLSGSKGLLDKASQAKMEEINKQATEVLGGWKKVLVDYVLEDRKDTSRAFEEFYQKGQKTYQDIAAFKADHPQLFTHSHISSYNTLHEAIRLAVNYRFRNAAYTKKSYPDFITDSKIAKYLKGVVDKLVTQKPELLTNSDFISKLGDDVASFRSSTQQRGFSGTYFTKFTSADKQDNLVFNLSKEIPMSKERNARNIAKIIYKFFAKAIRKFSGVSVSKPQFLHGFDINFDDSIKNVSGTTQALKEGLDKKITKSSPDLTGPGQ